MSFETGSDDTDKFLCLAGGSPQYSHFNMIPSAGGMYCSQSHSAMTHWPLLIPLESIHQLQIWILFELVA